ncbi:hypothetical protein SAMN05421819_0180 [Bryocella elongata]|uniref:TraB family protein n=2 Tax=Bryocella elongata TaxID=863522 RepID=A0A1H5SFN1_9BACT|nr:hypothetical protein SAMN05421819_0180 [Bryocella elongata]
MRYAAIMNWMGLSVACVCAHAALAQKPAEPQQPAVRVMVVGVFHMSNPGHDLHNLKVDDVLSAPMQKQIEQVNAGMSRFRPTVVMAEWPEKQADERYSQFLAGTLPPSRNEVVQLGFRLAKSAGLQRVEGIDADGEFPYEAVQKFAETHGQADVLARANAAIQAKVDRQAKILSGQGVGATLRFLNDPVLLRDDNAFYREMLRVGSGTDQPGAELLTAWYHRNFLICSNLIQHTKPGDRVVVFYGAGHAFLLRQCVAETPGFELVEPNGFLPR